MKLTVGPLPPAVYWRRRAAVAGGLLALILLLVYACSGSGSDANPGSDGTKKTPTPGVTYPSEEPEGPADGSSPDSTSDSGGSPGGESGGSSNGGSAPDEQAPQCEDSALSVAAKPVRKKTPVGARLKITLVFTNISDAPCKRDIGADEQEVRLEQDDKRLWSSDDCRPQRGSQVEVLRPNQPVERFWVTWDGRTSAPKCEGDRKVVGEGTYQIVARLGGVKSTPVTLKVVATS